MNSIYTALRMGGPLSGAVGGLFGSVRTLVTRPQVPTALTTTPTTVLGTGTMVSGLGLLAPLYATLGGVIARTKVRNHFPRPSEIKRIRKHGWKTRMATLSGRKILMRRILKGRHVLSH